MKLQVAAALADLCEIAPGTLSTFTHVTYAVSDLIRVTMLDDQVITALVVAAYASCEVVFRASVLTAVTRKQRMWCLKL